MVEDVESDAEITLRELTRAGLHVDFRRVETEGELARECGEFNPDVVLSDFALPNFDGLSALRIVRQLKPDVPFIFVSGTIGEETAIRSLRSGATDYVLKTNLSRLASAVQRSVQEARERAALRSAEAQVQRSERTFRSFMENLRASRSSGTATGASHSSIALANGRSAGPTTRSWARGSTRSSAGRRPMQRCRATPRCWEPTHRCGAFRRSSRRMGRGTG
jgi:CheY-like chemotaxis protein